MNNNNNNNIDNSNSIKLYNSVFNNKYIKRIIFNHLSLFNIFYNNNIHFISLEQLEQFKYKDYLNKISLNYSSLPSRLPKNIKHINIIKNDVLYFNKNLNSTANHLESIILSTTLLKSDLNYIISTSNSSVLSKLVKLTLSIKNGDEDQVIINNVLTSVRDLKIIIENGTLKKDMVPNSLQSIEIYGIKSIEGEMNSFKMLSYVQLMDSPPSIISHFSSNQLVKLVFQGVFGDDIIDSNIIFPESLQELSIYCHSFNTKFPNNLKSLVLEINVIENTFIFPSSLEHIAIYIRDQKNNNKEIFDNRESVPHNLKSLEFGWTSIVDNNGRSILPNKLEELIFGYSIGFNEVLQVNQLPPTLTYLDLGYNYNQVIEVNVLPYSLKTLMLGNKYTQIINPLAIPQQLELLEIKNSNYSHAVNLPVSTHPNTLIVCKYIHLYYNKSNTLIRKLELPIEFNSSLSTLQLQDKSSLEYLHLGSSFDQPIELSDLPINNNIKTLVISYRFRQTINLEYFQNLESIVIQEYSNPKIITKTTINNQQDIIYNNYNLKNIIVHQNRNDYFLINLDINFYQFIKIKYT